MNAVASAGIDRDAVAHVNLDGRDPDTVVDDADRVGDEHRAIAGRVEDVDLATSGGLGKRKSKRPARQGERAGAAVGSLSGNKSPVSSCLRWRGGKTARENRRSDGL